MMSPTSHNERKGIATKSKHELRYNGKSDLAGCLFTYLNGRPRATHLSEQSF